MEDNSVQTVIGGSVVMVVVVIVVVVVVTVVAAIVNVVCTADIATDVLSDEDIWLSVVVTVKTVVGSD